MTFCMVFSGICTAVIYLFGRFDISLQTLLLFIVLDFITGLLKAAYIGKLKSYHCFKGIIKKIGYLLIVALVTQLDRILKTNGMLRTPILYFFVANEGISILENWALMGLPIPKFLINKLDVLKESSSEEKK